MIDLIRRSGLIAALIIAVLALGLACGDDDDDDGGETATPAPSETGGASPTGTPSEVTDPTLPGAAGIASNPRDVEGYEGVWQLDDGLAMFATRDEGETRTGVADDSIKICHPVTLTGPTAAWSEANALLEGAVERINAAGGIHGRDIELVIRDDGGDPTQATQVVRELVENDGCFLIFGHKGTAVVSAVSDYLDEQGVPNIMVGASAATMGEPGLPTRIQGTLPVLLGMYAFGQSIWNDNPDEKIALMYQNDDYGKSGLDGFEAAAEATGGEIAISIPFDPSATDISGQLNDAVNSGATSFAGIGYPSAWPKFLVGIRETLGSDMQIFDPGGLAVQGTTDLPNRQELLDGLVAFRCCAVAITDDSQAVNTIKEIISDGGLTANQFAVNYAQTDIEVLTRILSCAGPDLTREGVLEAMNGGCLDGSWTCSVCLGPVLVTPDDRWPIESLVFTEYDGDLGDFVDVGDPVAYETAEGTGIRGNIAGFDCSADLPCPWEDGCTPDADRCSWKQDD